MLGRDVRQPFRVDGGDQGVEQVDVIGADAVIGRVRADGDVRDRGLTPEGAVLAIEAQGLEGSPVQFVPRLGFGLIGGLGDGDAFLGVFFGQLRQPSGCARRAAQAVPEGAAEFFASVSTNSTSSCAICPAHHSTALTTAR